MTYGHAVNYLFTTTYILLWMILESRLENLMYKPKIMSKLLEGIEQVAELESENPDAGLVRSLANAISVIIKREMGVQTGEVDLVNAMKQMLERKRDKMLAIGFAVCLMLCVWVGRCMYMRFMCSRCRCLVKRKRKKWWKRVGSILKR